MRNKYLWSLKEKAFRTWANVRGWRTARRIIVFESDDWGAIRMRDPKALRALQRQGVCLDKSRYHDLDCLENREDLEGLFGLLDSYRDQHGNPPIFTFNTVMGNPNFEAIRADQFERYTHESLWRSYQRYHGENLQQLWAQAMGASLIRPQFHAREHLNVRPWMNDLRDGRDETRRSFDQDYYGLTLQSSSLQGRSYLAAYWPESAEHLREIQEIVLDGLNKFEEEFGFRSRTFVACNYVLPRELEAIIAEKGVRLIQGQRGQFQPTHNGSGSVRRSYTGMRNQNNQIYSVRNVMFEPYINESKDWVASAVKEIGESFAWGKPAIISTHRINYVSGMNQRHRDRTLYLLDDLLRRVLSRWPDIEFMSSDRLLSLIDS